MVGASSGVYGLLLSHLAHLYLNNQKISYKIHRIVFVTVLTLGDIIHSLTHCLINNNEEPKIHIIAHLAGGLSGLLLGKILSINSQNKSGLSSVCFRSLKNKHLLKSPKIKMTIKQQISSTCKAQTSKLPRPLNINRIKSSLKKANNYKPQAAKNNATRKVVTAADSMK
ncbi:hypothetical protein PVAND_016522 [Polypedilum vanderplanki]|uniref:Peptidase S54 rhomboid domain-containing protein n=1 Tax=Polypedilum vanderplanki TaxID=319348 RepID=A0A9J6BFU6_POLVA|nr:hypothetical protein PVAND_016522 [Polypedilum vanderplanki]